MQQLGESVVSVLKKNGVSRDHPLFKHYYTKLFNVSKHFLNVRDLLQIVFMYDNNGSSEA